MKASSLVRLCILNLVLLVAVTACSKKHYQGFNSSSSQQYRYVSAVQSVETPLPKEEIAPALVTTESKVVSPALSSKVQRIKTLSVKTSHHNSVIAKDSASKDSSVVAIEKKGKSQALAFVMAIASWYHFAGMVPVHRFYLGGKKNSTAGILMIVFGVLTLGIVSYFWGLSDWIRILKGTLKPGEGDYNPKFKKRMPSEKRK